METGAQVQNWRSNCLIVDGPANSEGDSNPGPPMSIEHVTTSLDLGGAQAMLGKLVANPSSAGTIRHNIVSLVNPGSFTPPTEHAKCHSLGMTRGIPNPMRLQGLVRITREIRPDVLQGWMYHGNLAATLAGIAGRGSLPILWNVRHSLADPKVESRSTRALLALSARLSRTTAAIIYNSHAAARQHEAIGFASERSLYIPNGFDCIRYRPDRDRRELVRSLFGIAGETTLIAMVARFHPMKDHTMLIRAVGRARQLGHDLHLLLVGTDLDAPPAVITDAIKDATLPPDRVTLAGERSDVADWLPGLDILALSSAWGEAFPNILGEAMACGVPCIATNVGDTSSILGESGLIVPPRDAEAMAFALAELASIDREARFRRGDAGRERVLREFEIGKVVRQYHSLYTSMIRRTPAESLVHSMTSSVAGADPK